MYARHFSYDIMKCIVIEVFIGADQELTGTNRATMSKISSNIYYCEFIYQYKNINCH